MVKCSFSGEDIPKGTGKMFIKKDGKVLYFKDNKSEKNFFKLNRKPRTTKWTQEYKKEKKQRLATMSASKEREEAKSESPKKATKKSVAKKEVKK
ncbi:50S ribosomal protein L24e [archaeon]|jgi:large subunit ribosomal protein L24e|nr:50S ribosomal protein L24e [archaeon]MBT4646908.1 50S ribosomal protein L24e [archaeon]MBT6820894.1 50S ribosomal protein L24e [archaeon]